MSDENPITPGSADREPSTWDILRRRFLAGLITIIPAAFTIWVITITLQLIYRTLGRYVRPQVVYGLEVAGWPSNLAAPVTVAITILLIGLFILGVGILTRFLVVRRLIGLGEAIVSRIPLVRFFYVTPKEVINILTTRKREIKRVVLIEYPRKDVWTFAYATSETIHQPDGKEMVAVFMPSTPNPTTGFMMLIPIDQVRDVNIPIEDAVRMIISGGILSPNHYHTAPFRGIEAEPKLPPPEPLTTEPPPESQSREMRRPDDDEIRKVS